MSQVQVSDADDRHDLSHSRPGTPGGLHVGGHSHPHPANIAPPHMFDAVTLDGSADRTIDHSYANSPYYAQARHGDPSPLAILSGAAQSSQHMDGHAQPSTSLSTRVSELEVINNLFRDRVAHLENIEHDLRRQLDEASLREQNLRRIIEELQPRYEPPIDPAERQLKRLRSEFINDDSEIVDHGHVRDDRDGHAESLPPIRETLAPS
jgi:GATA-binding protein